MTNKKIYLNNEIWIKKYNSNYTKRGQVNYIE